MSGKYEYLTVSMDEFDEQRLGYYDKDKMDKFIEEKSDEEWELVSVGDKFIVFKRLKKIV